MNDLTSNPSVDGASAPASIADGALAGLRICDFTGQLAGAGATKWLAAFGAEVIRIEDPERDGRWDILRGGEPFIDDRRGINLGGAFNNHNAGKKGITLNLRLPEGKEILEQLILRSDAVTENFAAGVLEKWGFGYERLKAIKPDIVYVSNCGFGHEGPYSQFKTWGPIVQAVSGLTYSSGLSGQAPAGWGYSYMDHTGGYYMAMAIMMALLHRGRTGEGQWVDLACSESALTLHGPALLDWSVNGVPARQADGMNSNRSQWLPMAPHGIYPTALGSESSLESEVGGAAESSEGQDDWIAIACRNDNDWEKLRAEIDQPWALANAYDTQAGRLAEQDALDLSLSGWTARFNKFELAEHLERLPIPVAPVMKPRERIEGNLFAPSKALWPSVSHTEIGDVRIDGQPATFSATPWQAEQGAPCLSEHTNDVLTGLLDFSAEEVEALRARGVI